MNIKTVVITGTNEPMQDQECIRNMIEIIRNKRSDIKIEIQTRYYKAEEIFKNFDLVAYSISKYELLDKLKPINKNNRYTIILTDSFENKKLEDILKKIPDNVNQVTFKTLQYADNMVSNVNDWIRLHRMNEEKTEILQKEINEYKGNKSLKYDANCMESSGGYIIYREDGRVYKNWESNNSI